MRAKLFERSINAKTGLMPTSISSDCPPCALRGAGCYAENWPLARHWQRVKDTGPTWSRFVHAVAALPGGLWRHNVAGDLPMGDRPDRIDPQRLRELVEANQGRRGFTYTHFPVRGNLRALRHAIKGGFVVNVSTDNLDQARAVRRQWPDLPVVVLLPIHPQLTIADDVVICPNAIDKKITCARCELCASSDRDFIIGFPAHGTRQKLVEVIAKRARAV